MAKPAGSVLDLLGPWPGYLLAEAARNHPIGAAYSYCNSGFAVLGRMIEVLDDRIWDASLQARLVEPLGLTETVTLPEQAHRLVADGRADAFVGCVLPHVVWPSHPGLVAIHILSDPTVVVLPRTHRLAGDPLVDLSALAGDFASDTDDDSDPPLVQRADGSWLVSGSLSADALSDRLGVELPDDRDYATVAGFALSVLKRLPETGERFRHDGWRFEIVDMDGRKIDKLIASEERS